MPIEWGWLSKKSYVGESDNSALECPRYPMIVGVGLRIRSVVVEKWRAIMIMERKLALIHRVLVPDKKSPREYAILMTDTKSIFIRQEKTRSKVWLRGEMKYGTSLVTDVTPKTLEDYEQTTVESLASDSANLAVPHRAVVSLMMKSEEPRPHWYEFPVWLMIRNEEHRWRTYDFEMNYRDTADSERSVKFYMVPLGMYVKPRRLTQTKKTILREYATDALEIFQMVLPANVITRATMTVDLVDHV